MLTEQSVPPASGDILFLISNYLLSLVQVEFVIAVDVLDDRRSRRGALLIGPARAGGRGVAHPHRGTQAAVRSDATTCQSKQPIEVRTASHLTIRVTNVT
jgi:hypothetical protein